MESRDIVVIGASAGGVEPLKRIASDLAPDLYAAVFVVLHLAANQKSVLAELLDGAGPLRAAVARDGEKIQRGRIYVAPPDVHLMLDDGSVRVTQGPPENRHRPSVDVLFRSAARFYGPRVIGVVLSGALDDGTAGLIAIKIRGGLAIVQDPAETFASDMPRNAMKYLQVDEVLRAAAIGPALNRLTHDGVDPLSAEPPTDDMIQETRIARLDPQAMEDEERPGVQSEFACPSCSGVLWEIQEGNLLRFRCRTGHAFSPETLIDAQDDGVERALYMAIRAIEERLSLRRRLIEQARRRQLETLASEWEAKANELEEAAESLRRLLLKRRAATTAPAR
jgi:two-component system chemotaxis response regulator CheB